MAVVLFTDFGSSDIYLGQVKAVLHEWAPRVPVIDLANDLPSHNVAAAAHLLDALQRYFPDGSVFLCVVDPGVGTARAAVLLEAGARRYIGPDNGLLSVVAARAGDSRVSEILWRPERLSRSFHGRDLFAPVAALLADERLPPDYVRPQAALGTVLDPADLNEIIYIDHYGNASTGIRAARAPREAALAADKRRIAFARVFAEVPRGEAFWYENSHGLVEIAVNGASAAKELGLRVGQPVRWLR